MSMVERVARAIYADREKCGIPEDAVHISGEQWRIHIESARAAIEPIREAVIALIAAREALYEEKAGRRDPFREDIANQYDMDKHGAEAMRWLSGEMAALFDAALKDPTP